MQSEATLRKENLDPDAGFPNIKDPSVTPCTEPLFVKNQKQKQKAASLATISDVLLPCLLISALLTTQDQGPSLSLRPYGAFLSQALPSPRMTQKKVPFIYMVAPSFSTPEQKVCGWGDGDRHILQRA